MANKLNAKTKRRLKRLVYIMLMLFFVFNSLTSELTGVTAHIIAGSTFAALACVHIYLSRKAFIYSGKYLFSRKTSVKNKANFIVDVLLILNIAAIAVTGVMMANHVLPSAFKEPHDFEIVHGLLAAFAFFLMATHGILHIHRRSKRTK